MQPGNRTGTPNYMAPELARGALDCTCCGAYAYANYGAFAATTGAHSVS